MGARDLPSGVRARPAANPSASNPPDSAVIMNGAPAPDPARVRSNAHSSHPPAAVTLKPWGS